MRESYKDLIEWRFSDIMPSAFLTHSEHWAILGLFIAHKSYMNGPMIEVSGGTSLWKMLHDEWNVRWNDPTPLVNHPQAE